MKNQFLIIPSVVLLLLSCKQYVKKEITDFKYYDVQESDTVIGDYLIAITNEEYLQYGSRVAYIGINGDSIIPFGKYAHFGTDTLFYFASVIEHPNDSVWGRRIAIDRNQNILFDMVIFDNGPEEFHDGLLRVLRNGKMGYANKFGQVVIPCKYDYARWFENGLAEVTLKAREYIDMDEHRRVESDEWFTINKKGNELK
jgi:hypothetical protein